MNAWLLFFLLAAAAVARSDVCVHNRDGSPLGFLSVEVERARCDKTNRQSDR